MLVPNTLKAVPAENYDDLKKQFFALKTLCESKIKQCSNYSKKLAEYDRESLIAGNEALESEREMNAQLTEELEKANERVKELENSNARMLHEVANQYDGNDSTEWSIGANHVFRLFAKWISKNEQLRKEQE